MKKITGINKKWKWMVLMISVFLVVFMAAYSFTSKDKSRAAGSYTIADMDNNDISAGGYVVRRAEEHFVVVTNDGATVPSRVHWESSNPSILGFATTASGSALSSEVETSGTGRPTVNIRAIGQVGLYVTLYDGSGKILDSFNITLTVALSINEFVGVGEGNTGVTMAKIFDKDSRKALIMEKPGSHIEFGESAFTQPSYLNLNYGSAKQTQEMTNKGTIVTWSSSNKDVFDINNTTGTLTAVGAGRATLAVTYHEGNYDYTDSISVYVRPTVTCNGKEYNTNDANDDDISDAAIVNNMDKIDVSVQFKNNPLDTISDKLDWVISRNTTDGSNKKELVSDSLGKGVSPDTAKLVWLDSEEKYQLRAKAGVYTIQFYVHGTYGDFEEARNFPPGCAPVSISNLVRVPADFVNKTISINVGGQYNLPDAFNISPEIFGDYFETHVDEVTAATGGAAGNTSDYVDYDNNKYCITAKKMGTVTVSVIASGDIAEINIPGVSAAGQRVTIIVNISDSFTLNVSNTTLSVGETLNLHGILGSGTIMEQDECEWSSVSDPKGSYIKFTTSGTTDTNGTHATVTAVKATQTNNPVDITLKYTSSDGITLTATCTITVAATTTSFKIQPEKLTMQAGEKQTINTNLTAAYKLTWLSSDTSIATVVDNSAATPAAQVTALKPGNVVITAINVVNNAYATCILTVEQSITSLEIGIAGKSIGKTYTTVLSQGFVFMEPVYKPNDATEKTFTWSSSDPSVATVDNTGKVTLLKEGSTHITVSSSKCTAFCLLDIVSKPLTSITTDVSELSMVKGDTRTVKATLSPADATDPSLVWTSLDTAVAKVDNNGKITAVGVGSTYVRVEAVLADKTGNKANKTIKVTVRDKLTSIAFESKTTYINVGGTKQMDIIYKPDKDVNKTVTFKSSDTSIFTVTNTGIIKGVAEGQAILTCESEELGRAGVISCIVHVTGSAVDATDFVITPAAETMYIGSSLQLTKKFTPAEATNQSVTWSSSDPAVASVNSVGTVFALKEGKAVISAVYTDTKDKKPWIRTSTITVEKAPIPVTDFDVEPDTNNIKVGEKFSITPVFTPKDASNKNVDYQSLDEGVVVVDEKGEVTGIGAGDAIIQCQSEDGGFIATCFVHVDNAIDFTLSPSTKEIAVGKSFKITKVTNPENAKKTAEWLSSNSSIATVDSTGKVTTKRIGTCTITCTLTKYNQSAKCKVKVQKLKSSITLDKKNIRLGIGQTYRIKKTVSTNNTSKPKVKWKSSSKRVATVSSGGKITGKHVGLTKITATTKDSVHAKATCKVRVIRRVSSIKLNSDYVVCYVGRSKKLTAKTKPSNATIKKVKWTSGDNSIARVTGNGRIRALAEGSTYITASTTDGSNKKARCYVRVLDSVPATSIVVAQPDLTMKRGDSTKLTYRVLPEDTSDNLKFASDNERVAKVSKKGRVKAVGTGDATITILATSGVSSTVNVNVVALNKTSVTMRQYDTENLTVFGTAGDSTVTWYSANARVATVEDGKIVGRAEGTTYIYAYVDGCKLSCRVTITSVNE